MPAGLPVAVMLLAQAASAAPTYGPAPPPAPKAAAAPATGTEPGCKPADPNSREIVICAEKPQGYRLNPDVLKAKRQAHSAGRPQRRGPIAMKDNSCTVVGPAPCMNAPMINLLAAAATASEMAARLSKGQEIGSMFVTDPHPSEYQLYLEAKAEREAKEAEAKAKATAAKAKAAPSTGTASATEPANLESAPAK
jgi:hypothetical protein